MTLVEQFDAARAGAAGSATNAQNNILPFFRKVAAAVDEIEGSLAPLRATDPTVPRLVPRDASLSLRNFTERLAACNGMGDVLNLLRDIAERIDAVKAWQDASAAPAAPAAAGASEHLGGPIVAEPPPAAASGVVCPKCGKTLPQRRGSHFHIKHCQGNA